MNYLKMAVCAAVTLVMLTACGSTQKKKVTTITEITTEKGTLIIIDQNK